MCCPHLMIWNSGSLFFEWMKYTLSVVFHHGLGWLCPPWSVLAVYSMDCVLFVEAGVGRNTLERCWWLVKINIRTERASRANQSSVWQSVALNEEHDTALLSLPVYSAPSNHYCWWQTQHKATGLLKWASEWVHSKVIRGEVGRRKSAKVWIRPISFVAVQGPELDFPTSINSSKCGAFEKHFV